MGCDIHAIVQAKKDGKWVDVESKWKQDRHYFLFSWLADVRNGYGFAGVPTYAPITPISTPRGLPDDFEVSSAMHQVTDPKVMGHRAEYLEEGDTPEMYMGDHSHSWLTADEILAAQSPDKVWQTGIVERSWFDMWDGVNGPDSWSGGISGNSVRVAESPTDVTADSTHVRIWWIKSGDTLNYFTDEIRRLRDLHGEVRIVFGFDS